MKFIKRLDYTDYIADQTVTIGSGGGSDTVEDVPLEPTEAIEVELDDGRVVVLLAYTRK